MDIHFCDLCNESVPATDLTAGRAVRRKGRVVCAACNAAMGGLHAGEATPSFAAVPPGLSSVPGAQPAQGRSSGAPTRASGTPARGGNALGVFALTLSLLALVGAGVGIVFLMRESNQQRDSLREANASLKSRIASVDGRVTFALEETTRQLEELATGIDGQFDRMKRERAAATGGLEASIDASVERLARLERDLQDAREDLGARDDRIAARLDGIVLAAVKEREQQERMRERLADLEDLVHSGAVAAAPSEEDIDAPPAWQVALDDLSSADSAVRWNGVQALAESGDPAVVPYLVPLLEDSDIWVRMAAAGALGDLGATEAVGPLIDALSDPETAVRERAMLSLRSITGRSFRFDPGGSDAERARAIEKWRDWWEKAGGDLAAD